ncbi:MAG: helix-turn-helix transcriptional regulator [Alicyclobacillaceae bacterium]|nr:helix-turn-helix transcriptional regulator [Alicyclobacillaceae bacterium]
MTQADLGADIVSPSMISQIEAGRAKPSYALLNMLANRLGMPVEHFMSDLEEQFTLSTHFQLAEYYLLTQQPDEALRVLRSVPAPESPGLNHQEYCLRAARAYRLQQRWDDAVRILEELREHAFRMQDDRLHFQVCRESGHVEYAMDNLLGARHEWLKALRFGETLSPADGFPLVQLHGWLAEICILMHDLHLRLNQPDEASLYLQQAANWCSRFARFRDLAAAYIEDGLAALAAQDAARAKDMIDQAVALIDAARWVELFIRVQVKQSTAEDHSQLVDPWSKAALSMATVSPGAFLDMELERIDQLLQQGQTDKAARRIRRCFDILEDYDEDAQHNGATPAPAATAVAPFDSARYRRQLAVRQAEAEHQQGQRDRAIRRMEAVAKAVTGDDDARTRLRVWGLLVQWYAETGEWEDAQRAAEQLEQVCMDVFG